MGIIRTRTILTRSTGRQTHQAVLHALAAEKMEIRDAANPVRAKSPRALLKNRWAADLTIEVLEDRMVWHVDALGDKHDQIMNELVDRLPQGMVDDQGVADAVARMPKISRFFGKAEVKNLAAVLSPTERVVAIAGGTYRKMLGALVLTTERLVFFDQSYKSRDVEEFALDAIQSLGVSTRLGGEKIDVSISGRSAEITGMQPGEAERIVAAYRQVRDLRSTPAPGALSFQSPDAMDQLRKLGELHQAGILTSEEFAAKKADLLGRM